MNDIIHATLKLTYEDGRVETYEVAQDSEIIAEPDEIGWGYGFDDPDRTNPVLTRWFRFRVGGIVMTLKEGKS